MTVDTVKTASFLIVNAFTSSPYGGNPAAVVFLKEDLPDDILLNIARNFNQPIVTYIYPTTTENNDDSGKSATFGVRWFTTTVEIGLCGHGSLAAAGAMFSLPEYVSPTIEILKFQNRSGVELLTAHLVGDKVQISLPEATITLPSPTEEERLKGVVRKALGDDINIKFVGIGGEGFEHQLMVEIDEKDDLGSRQANPLAFLESGHSTNIITSASSDPNVAFVSRMFAPSAGVMEDHVCGSAHCIMGPYWAKKQGSGSTEKLAKQVSQRGGVLAVTWQQDAGRIVLAGQTKVTMRGEIML